MIEKSWRKNSEPRGEKTSGKYSKEERKRKKMKTLLGSRQIIDGGKLERKNRDAAVKKFLEKIDEIRIGKNLPATSEDQEDSTNQQKARSKKR